MATAATTGRTEVAQPDPLGGLAQLATMLGGTKTTSNAGDTAALEQALAGLRGIDGNAQLASIFQQASAQMPGLQSSMGRALGARSGNNSALATALQQLLAQTTLTGQDQLAKQQLSNLQAQTQAGTAIAQATKGTTQKSGTDTGQAAKTLALLAGLNKLFGKDGSSIQDTAKSFFGGDTQTGQAPVASPVLSAPAYGDMSGTSGQADLFTNPFMTTTQQAPVDFAPLDFAAQGGGFTAPNQQQVAGDAYMPAMDVSNQMVTGDAYMPAFEPQPTQADQQFEFDWENATNYADGGIVKAGGSRRSANPSIKVESPEASLAALASSELQRAQAAPNASVIANASGADITNALVSAGPLSSSGGSYSGGSYTGGINEGFSSDAAGTLGKIGAASNVSGVLGGPTLGAAGNVLGLASGLSSAKSPEQALGMVGKSALGMVSPTAAQALGFAMNPSKEAAMDMGLSLGIPGYGAISGLLGLAGLANPREIAVNAVELSNPNQMMSPEQQAMAALGVANPNSAGLTGQANAMEGDALSNLLSITDAFGTGNGGTGGDFGGFGDRGPGGSSGEAGAAAEGANASGPGGHDSLADGGPINGKGTGISDSVPINGSVGEYIMSADVVETLGEDFFDQLQAAFHTPAAQQKQQKRMA
jgi:hypothetical protein